MRPRRRRSSSAEFEPLLSDESRFAFPSEVSMLRKDHRLTARKVVCRKPQSRTRLVRHVIRHVNWGPNLFSEERTIELSARIKSVSTRAPVRSSRRSSKLPPDEGDQSQDAILERAASQVQLLRPIIPRRMVVSTIMTGGVSAVYYGYDSLTIRGQVDRLALQIARGRCLPGGPLGYDGSVRRFVRSRQPSPSYTRQMSLLSELYFEISTDKIKSEKNRVAFGEWFKGVQNDPQTWVRTPAPSPELSSLWEIYRQAAFAVVEPEFLDRCRSLKFLKTNHDDKRVMRKLATLRTLLRRRIETQIDLAAEIAARVLLDCQPNTLRKLVHSITPSAIYFR